MIRKTKSMDGNTAAAHVAYAFTEVAAIYPITPSSPMADHVDQWSAEGRKNLFGSPVKVVEMQSESGAAGTVHGSLGAGALTTTFTASQGLLLMIPNMYRIAGDLLPAVFHVSARAVSSHALNIFGDHSDVMACRQTGFAMLAESNPQEVMDLSAVAHLSAIKGRVPFLNFFDGFRTSHEIQKIGVWDYEDLRSMLDMDAVAAFRARALNPEHPSMRGSHENGDIFFQHREASNSRYDALPNLVEDYMHQVNARIGSHYELFNYYGASDADRVIVAMGSVCDVCEEVVDYLTSLGEKVGLLKVRLFRPFSLSHFMQAIPDTCRSIAVLDRTKEPGAVGEPLYLDTAAALLSGGRTDIKLIHGRYGLGSKDTPPSSIFAVYEELSKPSPKPQFTMGITDDVTLLSLEEKPAPVTTPPGTIECKFWGIGGDGTVGANKNSIKIIGNNSSKYVQAYFQYDSRKTGGVTVSHLRFGDYPIHSPYYVNQADFAACHNPSYVTRGFPMLRSVKPGGTFLLNCQWSDEELEQYMPAEAKRYAAKNDIKIYLINAIDLALEIGMGKRTNTILQSAFFALSKVMPIELAIRYMKDAATETYRLKGPDVVDLNHKAIDLGAVAFRRFHIPDTWINASESPSETTLRGTKATVDMVSSLSSSISRMDGDSLPVSAFLPYEDGTFPPGASAYEKRGVSVTVPVWNSSKCVQCNLCSFLCPHAAIRPFLLTGEEAKASPSKTDLIDGKSVGEYKYAIAVSPLDCMGCSICAAACPTKSLEMSPLAVESDRQVVFDYMTSHVSVKQELANADTLRHSQFRQPLLEFSGSCAGCAETSYARLVTQVCGESLYISNATGCSSIWGGPAAFSPYTTTPEGKGPAWVHSLFEDNAEHGLGLHLAQKTIRERLAGKTRLLIDSLSIPPSLNEAAHFWLDTMDQAGPNQTASKTYAAALESFLSSENGIHDPVPGSSCCEGTSPSVLAAEILREKDYLCKKTTWIFGGDGWAYDIGFGGVDHVLASGEDVNLFVFDTEVYSNTGGQASKASNIGQVAEFSAAGKETPKKSLAEIIMQYGNVYVAQVAMGANPMQTLTAIREAAAYPGPSLIIGYSPCEMHAIKGGMGNCQKEMRRAVDCGYWTLFRYNPANRTTGKPPFILDSKPPLGGYREFLMNEVRYSSLTRSFPERAEELFARSEQAAKARYKHLCKLAELYNNP